MRTEARVVRSQSSLRSGGVDSSLSALHCLQMLLTRLRSQKLAPPHSLHMLLIRLSAQMLDPLQSLLRCCPSARALAGAVSTPTHRTGQASAHEMFMPLLMLMPLPLLPRPASACPPRAQVKTLKPAAPTRRARPSIAFRLQVCLCPAAGPAVPATPAWSFAAWRNGRTSMVRGLSGHRTGVDLADGGHSKWVKLKNCTAQGRVQLSSNRFVPTATVGAFKRQPGRVWQRTILRTESTGRWRLGRHTPVSGPHRSRAKGHAGAVRVPSILVDIHNRSKRWRDHGTLKGRGRPSPPARLRLSGSARFGKLGS